MKLLKTIKDKDLSKDFKTREASRAVLFDDKNLVPILFVSKYNYHKLPGGGKELGEDDIQALKREAKEEVGCTIKIEKEIGTVIEYRSKFDLKQISYCYLGKILSKGPQKLEKSEINEGFKLVWLSLNDAISSVKNDKPRNYEGGFIQKRDLTFLSEAERLINDNQ